MAWFDSARADELYLSVIVVGEIRHGIERLARRDPARAGVFEKLAHRICKSCTAIVSCR